MLLTTILVDDENFNINLLSDIITKHADKELNIVATSNNFFDAVSKINEFKPNVLFLDIKLDRGTAFDLLSSIEDYSYFVVFVTAYDELALETFKYNTAYFILKPTRIKSVLEAVDCVKKQIAQSNYTQIEHIKNLINQTNFSNQNIFLEICSSSELTNRISHVRYEDILFLKASGGQAKLYIENIECQISNKPLKYFETLLLNKNFFRTHKSYYVNLNKISHISKEDGYYCVIKGGESVPISKRNVPLLYAKLNLNNK